MASENTNYFDNKNNPFSKDRTPFRFNLPDEIEKIKAEQKKGKDKRIADTPIRINGEEYSYLSIKKRIEAIKNKLDKIKSELTVEDNTILNLPLLEWKKGFKVGAIMVLHWLEASKKSVKLDYKFFISEKRLESIDIINLKNYFKTLNYLSETNLGYSPSNPDGYNLFLFNENIRAVDKSMKTLLDELKTATDNGTIGDYNDLSTNIGDKVKIKNNLFQSFEIGSIGDLDDVGAALGRYSLRCYFKGILKKNADSPIKWLLSIKEIGVRFVDEFSFNDDDFEYFSPTSWVSQYLGSWKNDADSPDVSTDYSGLTTNDSFVKLTNENFRNLRKKSKNLVGGDFLIYSDLQKIDDEFVKKEIMIF
jgi:Family of unknown function (DUF6402)